MSGRAHTGAESTLVVRVVCDWFDLWSEESPGDDKRTLGGLLGESPENLPSISLLGDVWKQRHCAALVDLRCTSFHHLLMAPRLRRGGFGLSVYRAWGSLLGSVRRSARRSALSSGRRVSSRRHHRRNGGLPRRVSPRVASRPISFASLLLRG